MAYTWDKNLETGHVMIDQQHKQLVDSINTLLDACSKGQGRAQIEDSLNFLGNYIVQHFKDEEALQVKYKYPDYVNHKQYHEDFKKVVAELVSEFKQGGATIPLVAKINSSIAGWLISHIKREDVKLAMYIKGLNK